MLEITVSDLKAMEEVFRDEAKAWGNEEMTGLADKIRVFIIDLEKEHLTNDSVLIIKQATYEA